jgi:hypothetical protein
MNTTIRNLIVALPLATAALAMTPGVAQADGPVIVLPPPGGDPQGPVIGIPTPDDDPVHPTGPGDLTAPQPCPTHGVCGGNDGDGGSGDNNGSGDNGGHDSGEGHHGTQAGNQDVTSIALPTRIDAGFAPAQQNDNGLDLTWLLASGALVTASGAAFAARRVRSRA